MMRNDIKRSISIKARLVHGMTEVLKEDISRAKVCAIKYDFVGLCKSLYESKETLQVLRDHLAELEYELYLAGKDENA